MFYSKTFFILFFTISINCLENDQFIVVKVKNGVLKGLVKETLFEHKKYYSFRGIPYAKPPIGKLRFLAPERIENWNKTLNAIDFKNVCTQKTNEKVISYSEIKYDIRGSEDCLYLNIYTPDISLKNKLPVIFYIHGGAFLHTGNDLYLGEDFLIEKDVILVTFDYRLFIFGFMSLGTEKYSGNMGIKDQIMALEWINENIKFFGGDSNKITIYGHSCGAFLAHLNVIMPKSRKLFQRAIVCGANAFQSAFIAINHDHKKLLMNYINNIEGLNIKHLDDLIKYLLNSDNYHLYKIMYDLQLEIYEIGRKLPNLIFYPIVEYDNAENRVIFDIPENMLKNSEPVNIDVMFEFSSYESMYVSELEIKNPELLELFDERFEIYLPHRDFDLDFDSEIYQEIAQEIREFYFKDELISNETLYEYFDLLSDTIFGLYSLDQAIKKTFKKTSGKIYLNRFSIDGKLNLLKKLRGLEDINGASHGDSICYIFKCNFLKNEYLKLDKNSLEIKTINTYSTLVTNFVKYGNPTPNNLPVNWKPIEEDVINFIDFTNDGLFLAENPNFKMMKFWDNLFEKYKNVSVNYKKSNKIVDEL